MNNVTWLQEHSELTNTVTHIYCTDYESVELDHHTLPMCGGYAQRQLCTDSMLQGLTWKATTISSSRITGSYGNQDYNCLMLDHCLNPIHTFTTSFLKMYFNIISPSMSVSQVVSYLMWFFRSQRNKFSYKPIQYYCTATSRCMFGSPSGSSLNMCLLLNCPNMDLCQYYFKNLLIYMSHYSICWYSVYRN
jgi:hypothetical protein